MLALFWMKSALQIKCIIIIIIIIIIYYSILVFDSQGSAGEEMFIWSGQACSIR